MKYLIRRYKVGVRYYGRNQGMKLIQGFVKCFDIDFEIGISWILYINNKSLCTTKTNSNRTVYGIMGYQIFQKYQLLESLQSDVKDFLLILGKLLLVLSKVWRKVKLGNPQRNWFFWWNFKVLSAAMYLSEVFHWIWEK